MCANIVLMASPEKIVLSGGVMLRKTLFPKIRKAMQAQLNGYIQMPQLTSQQGIDEFIAPSHWGNTAGLVGALTLAHEALKDAPSPSSTGVFSRTALLIAVAFGTGMALGALRH